MREIYILVGCMISRICNSTGISRTDGKGIFARISFDLPLDLNSSTLRDVIPSEIVLWTSTSY